jgi:VanZ family protein
MTNSDRIWKYWLPVLIMLTIQFSFSTSSFSSDETSRYIVPFLKFISPALSGDRLIFWHHVVRKAAHVTEYCILGILVYRAFHLDVTNPAMVRFLTVIFVACAALFDEFHQSFVAARTSSLFDVGFDCFGGMVALALIWGWSVARTNAE